MPAKKNKKMDTAIVVAIIGLVGTLIAALLASPLSSKLFNGDAKQTDKIYQPVENGVLVYSNNFEGGQTTGVVFSSEQWRITKDKGNEVLELNGMGEDGGIAFFGPNDFSDGVINFRLNIRSLGDVLLNFRSELGMQTYLLYFSPLNNEISLGYSSASKDWNYEPFKRNSVRPFQFMENDWYTVRLDVSGDQMTVWVDGNKLLTSSDTNLPQGGMEFVVQPDGLVWIDDVEVWQY